MAGHVLKLRGCTPEPLGNYLKGLGVFRLIAEQADPQARAWWKDGVLCIRSRFSTHDEMLAWFKDQYSPTALLAPWSVNSGLWPPKKDPPPRGDKRATPNAALRRLVDSPHARFGNFKGAVSTFLQMFGAQTNVPKQESDLSAELGKLLKELESQTKKNRARSGLLRNLRNKIDNESGIAWLDSIGTVRSAGNASAILFPLLADGGTEGVNSFVGNFYGRLCDHLPVDPTNDFWTTDVGRRSAARLRNALFGENSPDMREADAAGGLYWPNLVEAPNIGQRFIADPKKRAQPWDFVLAMEGSIIWSSAATRRGEQLSQDRVSFPFYCDSSLGGSPTPVFSEMPGGESIANGEVWCPMWQTPASILEIERLFTEGRLVAFEKTAIRATHFAGALASMGVQRGIVAFQRVGLLERSGSGSHTTSLAIHLGTWATKHLDGVRLLGELDDFENSVASNLQLNGNQPRRLLLARQQFETALFDVARQVVGGDKHTSGEYFLSTLTSAARLEQELRLTVGKVKFKWRNQLSERTVLPINQLRSKWLTFTSPDDAGGRIARAIAAITAWGERSSNGRTIPVVESMRANLLPVRRRGKTWAWDATSGSAVWSKGASLGVNLASVLRRRLIDAERGSGDGLPLWSSSGARFEDLLAYWKGQLDEERLTDLLHGFALVDTGNWNESNIKDRQLRDEPTPDLQTGAIWFDAEDQARETFTALEWNGRSLLSEDELRAACELPRIYHLLKLCFVGGRLPHRPLEGRTSPRTGDEPFPPFCLDVFTLLQAGRLSGAVQVAARRLRAKGYPAVLRDSDLRSLNLELDQCRRLAGMLLIPLRQPGVCAALAIRPQTTL